MYGSIVLKVAFGLVGLLLFTRLLGKKSMSDITPFDLIYTLVLGGLLEETIYDEKIKLSHFFLALTVWVGSDDLYYRVSCSKKFYYQ